MLTKLQNTILEMIATGVSLGETVDLLCRTVEQIVPDIVCSVLVLDPQNRLRHLAGPSLPESYAAAIDGVPIGPGVGSCGTAAFTGQSVTVTDIASHPYWTKFKHLALPLNLLACWSTPIIGSGKVLGTFAFYYHTTRGPSELEKKIVEACVHLCAIAIERDQRVAERRRLAETDALTQLPNRGRFNDVAAAHTARANMVVCSQALVTLARKMKERWDIPYFEGSFYGISDTSEALREIASMLISRGADPELMERTEALIAEEEAKTWAAMEPYRARLAGKRVLLYTGGVKSWSVIHALQEMGMEVVGSSVRKSTEADKAKALERLGGDEDKLVDAIAPRDMYAMFKEGRADIMLSGGRSQFVALKAKTPWLDINQERHHQYAGYQGMVTLVQQMDLALSNPIWEQVRRPAPWESGAVAER